MDVLLIYAFVPVLLVSTGCVSAPPLSRSECKYADWYSIGFRDATMGRPRSGISYYVNACMQYGVHPDKDSYMRGWNEGIKIYCTYEHGLEEGRQGKPYKYVCPHELESDFVRGYEEGRKIRRLELRINELERRRERIERKIDRKEEKLLSSSTSDAEKSRLRRELRDLDEEYRSIERELRYLEQRLYSP